MFGRKLAPGGQENFRSGTAGYMSGELRAAARDDPRAWSALQALAQSMTTVFKWGLPEQYAAHRAAITGIPEGCLMLRTPYTSAICNRHDDAAGVTARTAYHPDPKNVEGGYGLLSVWGEFTGGLLVFPQYRVAVDLRPGCVLVADNTFVHGNTAIIGWRLAVVLYAHESNRRKVHRPRRQ
jgi:hypothetical protein